MNRLNRFRQMALVCMALILALTGGVVFGQVKKGKTRLMKTAQWMKGVMKPHCTALKKGLEAGPSNEDAWEELATHTALINEASYLLMDDGRCPDGVWADAASKTLRQGSANVLKAIEAKDLGVAKTAFEAMTQGCAACHDKHREKK